MINITQLQELKNELESLTSPFVHKDYLITYNNLLKSIQEEINLFILKQEKHDYIEHNFVESDGSVDRVYLIDKIDLLIKSETIKKYLSTTFADERNIAVLKRLTDK